MNPEKIRKVLLFPVIIFILSGGYLISQKKRKDMLLLPMGSFKMKFANGDKDTGGKIVSIQAFFMSNEVTNKEYREFVNYILSHPDDSLCRLDIRKISRYKPDGKNKKVERSFFITYKNKDIAKNIIDTTVWEKCFSNDKKMQEKYAHYFRDKKFDDYPVVGVSAKNASLYCLWRSAMKNRKEEKKGKFLTADFRLPTEAEWAYAASEIKTDPKEAKVSMIKPVNEGNKNYFGLRNLSGNVSEWTSSFSSYNFEYQFQEYQTKDPEILKVVKGGNWQSGENSSERKSADPDSSSCTIGFRIAASQVYPGDDL